MTYETLDNLKAAVGILPSVLTKDVILTRCLTTASEAIDEYCNRSFLTTAETRTFQAAASSSSLLWVDDLLSVSAITVDGVALTTGDYELEPLNLNAKTPHYKKIVRKSGNTEIAWNGSLGTSTSSRPKVAITGQWGYASTVPSTIVQVCSIMAARLYGRFIKQYGNEGGVSGQGNSFVQAPKKACDPDCQQLLSPYVQRWAYTNVGR